MCKMFLNVCDKSYGSLKKKKIKTACVTITSMSREK